MTIFTYLSEEFQRREKIADFESGGFRSVGAVRAVHLNAGAEIAANSALSGFLRVGGAHGFAPLGDSAVGFENHGEDFAGAHEIGEFAEEGTLAMDGIEAGGFFLGQAHGFNGDNFEAGFVNAEENFTLEITTDGIGLNDGEGALERHKKGSL